MGPWGVISRTGAEDWCVTAGEAAPAWGTGAEVEWRSGRGGGAGVAVGRGGGRAPVPSSSPISTVGGGADGESASLSALRDINMRVLGALWLGAW